MFSNVQWLAERASPWLPSELPEMLIPLGAPRLRQHCGVRAWHQPSSKHSAFFLQVFFFFKVSFIAQPTWHQKRPCSYHSEQLLVQHVALGPIWFILVGEKYQGCSTGCFLTFKKYILSFPCIPCFRKVNLSYLRIKRLYVLEYILGNGCIEPL